MHEPPRGTVTFLFTDLEGSTLLWNDQEEAMASAVAHHDAILRNVFNRAGGYVFTTAGDSFAVAFPDADSAITAGVNLQREITATTFAGIGELRVRVGLHTGTAQLRDGDYFGPDVNLAARIMSAAHGGQILASLPTVLLAGGVTTVDLGQHHLKGVRDACPIHQVVVDGLSHEFPPAANVGRAAHESASGTNRARRPRARRSAGPEGTRGASTRLADRAGRSRQNDVSHRRRPLTDDNRRHPGSSTWRPSLPKPTSPRRSPTRSGSPSPEADRSASR